MLHSLKFEVTFPNGKNFKQDIEFKKGHTSITGLNGRGKSLIPEMIQYAYWGTKALRGKSDDYKKLFVEHTFEVKGQIYTVSRKGSTVNLMEGNMPKASGTTAVNKAIEAIFGYSFEVFQVANACNQGKVNQLGDMLPSERKKLVDETVGLNALDELNKFIGDHEKALRSEVKGIESVLVEPEAPVMPENYQPSSDIKATLEGLQVVQREHDLLKIKASVQINVPTAPEPCVFADKLPEYLEATKLRDSLKAQINAVLSQISGIQDAELTEEQIAEAEKYNQEYASWLAKSALKKQLESKQVRHDCPACNHVWHDADPRLSELQSLATTMEVPKHSVSYLNAQKQAVARASIKAEGGAKLIELTAQFEKTQDYSVQIREIQLYENAMQNFHRDLERAMQTQLEKAQSEEKLKDSKFEALSTIPALAAHLLACSVAEAQLITYQKNLTTYHTNISKVLKLKEEADQWGRAKQAIVELRTRVKGYLLPSLNKVATNLISSMTGGELSWITVNDNFDITVEGQRLETLSGAGKAVANLALRIALGQVLTNRVFSIMMLDEIDADCDQNRAAFVAQCMRRLTGQISQVIQISHKQIEADHYVKL